MTLRKRSLFITAMAISFTALAIGMYALGADGLLRIGVSPKGTIHGQVLLGPICPVERIPPDPACAPKPYKTTINVLRTPTGAPYKKVATDALGRFTISLAPGKYILRATSRSIYPRCTDKAIKVLAKKSLTIKIDCDTGIR